MGYSFFIHILVTCGMSRGFHAVNNPSAIITSAAATANCPKPRVPILITKDNENIVYVNSSTYNITSKRLPLVCTNKKDFELKEPVFAVCKNNTWVYDETRCLPKRDREREKTKEIILISGLVLGGVAIVFVLLNLVQFRWEKKHKERLDDVQRKSVVDPVFTGFGDGYYNQDSFRLDEVKSKSVVDPVFTGFGDGYYSQVSDGNKRY